MNERRKPLKYVIDIIIMKMKDLKLQQTVKNLNDQKYTKTPKIFFIGFFLFLIFKFPFYS